MSASPSPGGSLVCVKLPSVSVHRTFDMEPLVHDKLRLNVSALFQGSQRPSPRRHERYYFDDGNVVFLVHDTLYKVHRYFFQRDSSSFASMFSLPLNEQGLTDDKPISLADVTVGDMDIFLSILYPVDFGLFTAATVEDWTSILGLAAKWNFQSIKGLAIKQLAPITSSVDKVVLGRRHSITEWLSDAYSAICERRDALTLEEGIRLGMEDVIKIAAVRQGEQSSNFKPTEQLDVLKKTFGLLDIAARSDLHAGIVQTGDSPGVGESEPEPKGQQPEDKLSARDAGQWEACASITCREGGGSCTCVTLRENEGNQENRNHQEPHTDSDDCDCTICRRTRVDEWGFSAALTPPQSLKVRKKKKGKK